jgi:MtaA/CmuA family methyltransferase
MNGRERVLAMMDGKQVDRVPLMPITMMFACDQIGAKYKQYVTDYRVMAEAQLRTAERFDLDQVSCISDPTREATDLGATVQFFDDQPPAMVESQALLADKGTLARLRVPDPLGGGRMHDRVKAAALLKEKIAGERIVEGWIEGPCGQASNLRGINTLMLDFYDDPQFVHDLLAFVVELELTFARAQRDAGAELMGVGDPAASLVGRKIFAEFVYPYQLALVNGLKALGLRTRSHICGSTSNISDLRAQLGYDIVDVDTMVPIATARGKMGPRQIILGNVATVDVMQRGSSDDVTRAVAQCHHDAGPRYIVGAGCEVPRETPIWNFVKLQEYAQTHRPDLDTE